MAYLRDSFDQGFQLCQDLNHNGESFYRVAGFYKGSPATKAMPPGYAVPISFATWNSFANVVLEDISLSEVGALHTSFLDDSLQTDADAAKAARLELLYPVNAALCAFSSGRVCPDYSVFAESEEQRVTLWSRYRRGGNDPVAILEVLQPGLIHCDEVQMAFTAASAEQPNTTTTTTRAAPGTTATPGFLPWPQTFRPPITAPSSPHPLTMSTVPLFDCEAAEQPVGIPFRQRLASTYGSGSHSTTSFQRK